MRLDIDSFREIADSLVRNKSRSLLTGFGIFWGLFMLLFLVGGGKGLKEMLAENFEGFASNSVIMVSQETSVPFKGLKEGRYWSLKAGDLDRLKLMIPELDVVTGQIAAWGWSAVREGNSFSANVKGVNADYAKIEAPQLKYGRYINEVDVLKNRKVCVIGKRVYQELFPEGGDPCGTFLQVGSVYFQIVGLDVSSGSININGNATSAVTIPITIAQQLLGRGDTVDIICATGKSGVKMTSLEPRIREVMARQHLFDPTDEPALLLLNLEQIFTMVDTLFRGVNFLIWLVGLGTLLAGAIGVSNIMMVTVKERTIEIGIRRAIGATPRDILSQIIWESISLTVLAGAAGIVFSVLMLNMTEIITQHQAAFQINFGTAILALSLLALLGILAGLAPAFRAMNIKPVDAMRDE